MGLLCRLTLWSNVCVCGLRIQWYRGCRNYSLMVGHCSTYIISGMGHPRSDWVVPLVLCTVAYNIKGTGVVLQVPQDSVNLVENV